jgi:phosphatidylglycerol:prolipoprotein diacylglycerol transferase
VISFMFDPFLRLGQVALRWETLGTALAILGALVAGALIAGRTPGAGGGFRLRRDDLLFVALGATPGAVVGGRLGYVLLHLDYYAAHPEAIADPAGGGLELSLAVAGGVLTGLAVASLLDGSTRRWAHVAAVPLLGGLALGKAALALGGSGQGAPSDTGWATAYLGDGPWGSLAPGVPSHPSQLYEAAGYVLALLVLAFVTASGIGARRDGRLLAIALVLIALVRAGVALTWRDAPIAGPLRTEHLLVLVPLALGVATWLGCLRAASRADRRAGDLDWPDPALATQWRAETDRR